MSERERIAIVTGANRGIGFEVCRHLGRKGLFVLLTARDRSKAERAAEKLRGEGLDVVAHQLDVTSESSVAEMEQFVRSDYGRLDVLVNNAGVALDQPRAIRSFFDAPVVSTLHDTLEPNLFGPVRTCRAFVPMMRERGYGRVVNVSSELGSLTRMADGYPTYRISKTALNALTRIVAAEVKGTGVLVNSASPGWVRTDMGGPDAPRPVEVGADTIVWLATLPDDGPTGGFFQDREPLPW
ncbi:MAG: Short-chain dehydrogenase/reductase [Planctomycetota bacterium]|nr:Short-chain dehydrogenase/reductase [Planctomycetota bacterium]